MKPFRLLCPSLLIDNHADNGNERNDDSDSGDDGDNGGDGDFCCGTLNSGVSTQSFTHCTFPRVCISAHQRIGQA